MQRQSRKSTVFDGDFCKLKFFFSFHWKFCFCSAIHRCKRFATELRRCYEFLPVQWNAQRIDPVVIIITTTATTILIITIIIINNTSATTFIHKPKILEFDRPTRRNFCFISLQFVLLQENIVKTVIFLQKLLINYRKLLSISCPWKSFKDQKWLPNLTLWELSDDHRLWFTAANHHERKIPLLHGMDMNWEIRLKFLLSLVIFLGLSICFYHFKITIKIRRNSSPPRFSRHILKWRRMFF